MGIFVSGLWPFLAFPAPFSGDFSEVPIDLDETRCLDRHLALKSDLKDLNLNKFFKVV